MTVNRLILGDNLEILKSMENDTIDLIYLDPPFFSNRNYEVIWGDTSEIRSFQDRWAGGVSHYIIDKESKQTLTLKTGAHTIAVKAVDNDGIENMEIVQLKINGAVERGK
jgi:DNA modification methylase